MEDGYGKCHQCRKFGTSECPTSSKCQKFDDRPYFEPKEKKKSILNKIAKFYKWMKYKSRRGKENDT